MVGQVPADLPRHHHILVTANRLVCAGCRGLGATREETAAALGDGAVITGVVYPTCSECDGVGGDRGSSRPASVQYAGRCEPVLDGRPDYSIQYRRADG
jgi:hypothetical protein